MSSNPADLEQRLSRISTQWTVVFRAHGPGDDAALTAQRALLERYSGAVYRYLLAGVRDANVAEDLAQDFALRLVRGDFHRVTPERGRFRHYLKAVLSNLIAEHHRRRQAAPLPWTADTPEPAVSDADAEPDFFASWREELLDKSWKALAAFNATYHAALLLRINEPEMPSEEMARVLTTQLGKPVSAALVRKAVQRARERFAQLLLAEVSASLEAPTRAEMERELAELDLLRFCRSALE